MESRTLIQGVNAIVRFGNALVPIPDDVIKFLKQSEQPDTGHHHSDKPLFQKGDGVQIDDEPLAVYKASATLYSVP